jgi:hypothetical protein
MMDSWMVRYPREAPSRRPLSRRSGNGKKVQKTWEILISRKREEETQERVGAEIRGAAETARWYAD